MLADAGWDVEQRRAARRPAGARRRQRASATRPSTVRCACSAWAPACSSQWPRMPTARSTSPTLARVLASEPQRARRSSACRPATSTTGAFDDLAAAVGRAHNHGAWAPCRRRLRVVGRGQPGDAPSAAGVETADSWAHRRPQVAQRALRQRLRLLRPPRRARGGDVVHGRVPDRARRGRCARPSDYVPESSRRARGSPPGPPCASSAAAESPTRRPLLCLGAPLCFRARRCRRQSPFATRWC